MSTEIIPYEDLISGAILDVPGETYDGERIQKVRYDTNKRTKTDYAFVMTLDGITYIFKITSKGVKQKMAVQIPYYDSKDERNAIILNLYKDEGYKQEDIAFFMNISQGTVSNVLDKKKKKKKK